MQQALGLIKTMRPRQWSKNLFIFVPLIYDRKFIDLNYLGITIAGFFILCLISSSVYIINDLVDIEADREHPKKRNRPLPSGQLSPTLAIVSAIIIPLLALPAAYLLRPALAAVVGGYLILQILYSFYLKNIVLIDVMTLAAGFLLRVAAGVVLVDVVRFSPWLYLFTSMLTLFLGFAKRRQELVLLEENSGKTRAILEEYNLKLLDEIIVIVVTMTILTYALYTFSAEGLPDNHLMMLTNPFLWYGMLRYLYLMHVKGETRPPDEVALTDQPIQIAVGLFFAAAFLFLYLLNG